MNPPSISKSDSFDTALERLRAIDTTMDVLIEYLKDGGSDDMRVFNTWLGNQKDKALFNGEGK